MKQKLLLLFALFAATVSVCAAKTKPTQITSPDRKLTLTVTATPQLQWSLERDGRTTVSGSPALNLGDNTVWGRNNRLKREQTGSTDQTIKTVAYRSSEVIDKYTSLRLEYKEGFAVEFRLYNDGMAYRFVSERKGKYNITTENADFRFESDLTAWCPYNNLKRKDDLSLENQYFTSFESQYTVTPLSKIDRNRLMFLPVLIDAGDGAKICITESDLRDYPGMFLENRNSSTSLTAHFAPVPDKITQGGHNMLQGIVESRKGVIAEIDGRRSFPWRCVIVASSDRALPACDMVYRLAEECKIDEWSWIKPGKVAWDWWNDWGIYGVDFKAGVNTATYMHYIDFAADKGIEYVILDEGWSVNKAADLMKVVPEIDLKKIIDYATTRNVGIILWAGYWAFGHDMERICRHYSKMGVKGFKVDFMDRDDQPMMRFYSEAAATCARYHLLVDFHGACKPTGLSRTYPNVVNYEGVFGLEQMKWAPATVDQVTYDVTIPFIRMVAGPMDYTQGAMRNAVRKSYAPNYSEPMSQGTRCHQLAMYVVYDSPLNMMCDSPDNYRREQACADFIASIPTVWEQTWVMDGKVGEYIVTARRSGRRWYVGGMSSWQSRKVKVNPDFLPKGDYNVTIFSDGANAESIARDYAVRKMRIGSNEKIEIDIASGGGFAMLIEPVEE